MHTLKNSTLLFAVSLSALAGYVDAIGFLTLGGYFVSFMSGNSTQLAVSLVNGNIPLVLLLLKILLAFVSGTILGTLAGHFAPADKRGTCVLACVTLLLAGAAVSHITHMPLASILLMTLAMGVENAVFQRAGDIAIGLTYMTGTLVKMGQRLANALLGGSRYAWCPYLLLWMGLVTGGAMGAFFYSKVGLDSLWIGVLWSAAITFTARFIPLETA